MTGNGDLDVDAILEVLEVMHAEEVPDLNEGLRERKKRRVRQKISNVATAMFLVHGFDSVTVAQIAAACEVSEQTVFNYFPTKESMFLDRSEALAITVADAVRERGSDSLLEAVVHAVTGIRPGQWESPDKESPMPSVDEKHGRRPPGDEARRLWLSRLFCDVATGSPRLVTARLASFTHFTDEVSAALAQRIDADRNDPEVLLATLVIAGIVHVRQQSTYRHVQHVPSLAALNNAVLRDVLAAARLAEPTLTAFDNLDGAERGAFQARVARSFSGDVPPCDS
jgi:AcrR family transcriptional regulator